MRLWVASRSLALMNHGRVNHWANKWMNEWVSEWVYSMGESWPAKAKLKRSRCSAAMHCEFLPLWQIHKLRHSTINKWRRHCTCILQKKLPGKETAREWERERESRQAGSFKEFVKRQSLSLIMRFSRTRSCSLSPAPCLLPPAPCPLPHARKLVVGSFPALPLSTAIALHKGEKRTPKSQKRRAEWHVKICKCKISKVNELSLVYGSVWAMGVCMVWYGRG